MSTHLFAIYIGGPLSFLFMKRWVDFPGCLDLLSASRPPKNAQIQVSELLVLFPFFCCFLPLSSCSGVGQQKHMRNNNKQEVSRSFEGWKSSNIKNKGRYWLCFTKKQGRCHLKSSKSSNHRLPNTLFRRYLAPPKTYLKHLLTGYLED